MILANMKCDGRALKHETLAELRMMAVRRVIEDGAKPSEIAAEYGFCRNYLYPWLKRFADGGLDALVGRTAEGPSPKLTEKQRQQVRRWILGKDPRQYGFDYGLWSRRIVAAMLEQKMGVTMGLTAVGRLLASLEITPQKPLRRAYERDPAAVAFWLEKRYPELKRRAQRARAKIFFLDEAGFQSDPQLGRTYGLKGQTPRSTSTKSITFPRQRRSMTLPSAPPQINPSATTVAERPGGVRWT